MLFFKKQKPLTKRQAIGNWGEKRAEKYLKKKGLKTLARNYKCRTGEFDLVMVDTDRTVVFVEVKARTGNDFAEAEDSVNLPKKIKLSRTSRYFLKNHKIEDRPCRFDIVTIVCGQSGRETIKHYQNAFAPI